VEMTLMIGGFPWIKKPEIAALMMLGAKIHSDVEKWLKYETI